MLLYGGGGVVAPASVTRLPSFVLRGIDGTAWDLPPGRMAACPRGSNFRFFPGIPLPSTTFSASMRILLRASS